MSYFGIPIIRDDSIPPDTYWLVTENTWTIIAMAPDGYDRYGYKQSLTPAPLYTRMTLGAQEAAREIRRQRKRAKA